jgi:preprotein translocase subunit SecF
MDIIKNRYLYFLISLLIIIPGIVFMVLHWTKTGEGPLTLGVDFKGGALLEVEFAERPLSMRSPACTSISTTAAHLQSGHPATRRQRYAIRSKAMDDATKGLLVPPCRKPWVTATVLNFTSVSPAVGGR